MIDTLIDGPKPTISSAYNRTWSRVLSGGAGGGGGGGATLVGVGGENSISQNEMLDILCENSEYIILLSFNFQCDVWPNFSYFVVLLYIVWIVHWLDCGKEMYKLKEEMGMASTLDFVFVFWFWWI